MQTENKPISLFPRKNFFIDMLTRDISFKECILDLIDNSIDSFIGNKNFDAMKFYFDGEPTPFNDKEYKIEILLDSNGFSIEDNASGITKDDAKNKVFLLGAEPNTIKTYPGLSVYGVGMKRALFKIGSNIEISSKSNSDYFKIDLDVEAWRSQEEWNIEFSEDGNNTTQDTGTLIKVTNINKDLLLKLTQDNEFIGNLEKEIEISYSMFLLAGIKIKLNGKELSTQLPDFKLKSGNDFQSVKYDFEKDGVDIKIVAGATEKGDSDINGWYVFCNGRLLLKAEKTILTGRGKGSLRQFHNSVNHFIGFVYFRSNDLNKLPRNTGKSGVVFDSTLYQYALDMMIEKTTPIVKYLAKAYKPGGVNKSFQKLINEAGSKSLNEIQDNPKFIYNKEKVKTSDIVSVKYEKKLEEINIVKNRLNELGLMADNENEVGEQTFNYFMIKEVEND